MNGLIDLVLVEHPESKRRCLFKAPPFQVLRGDDVVCRTAFGEPSGKVIETMSCVEGSASYRFVVVACGAEEPLKEVICKIERVPLLWRDAPAETTPEEDTSDVPF